MAAVSSSQTETKSKNKAKAKAKPTTKKSLGVRFIRGRLYDSQNGKSCHQCRQKTLDFAASCKNKSENKQCTFHFCHKCLLNRYGEKAEEMAVLDDWMCPKCRGICNCSFCMKKRGYHPTGSLVHTAKAKGFSSVLEMLRVEGSETLDSEKSLSQVSKASASWKKRKATNESNGTTGQSDSNFQAKPQKMNGIGKGTNGSKQRNLSKDNGTKNSCNGNEDGDSLTEKSSTKRHQSTEEASVQREKTCKRNHDGQLSEMNGDRKIPKKMSRQCVKKEENKTEGPNNKKIDNAAAKHKPVKELHKCKRNIVEANRIEIPLPQGIELNSVAAIDIHADDVGHALQFLEFCEAFRQVLDLKKGQPEQLLWEIACGRCQRRAQDSPIVRFHMQLLSMIQKDPVKGYPSLNQTIAGESWLQSLTKYISESQYLSEEMQMNSFDVNGDGYDILDSSKKLKILNFLCDEVLGTEDFRSWIDVQNSEREKKAKENVLAEKEKREKEQQSDAVRSEPIFLDEHGRKFWILRCYSEKRDILLQDVRRGDLVSVPERWYSYDVEQKAIVMEYIASLR
ncbi:cell division cycle-associated 7-like protein [Quercus suber]|uniref:Cell division cycle-associated 7-like protein n=1 Tax=Quercus suber TaxID=58331 RepID=A0AAW0J9X4_QUESU